MKKNKKKLHAPKRSGLTYLILIGALIIVLLAVFIPVSYVSEYNENKVIPFAEDLNIHVGHEHEGEEHEEPVDYKEIKVSDITDFTFAISCSEYKDGSSATFKYYAIKNENSATTSPKNLKIKLAMCSNWIGLNQTTSSRSVTINESSSTISSIARTVTINSLPDLPVKGSLPFTTVETINLYVLLTYDSKVNGKTTSHTYLITIPYSEYIVGAVGGIEK